jgi:hypothetical protein
LSNYHQVCFPQWEWPFCPSLQQSKSVHLKKLLFVYFSFNHKMNSHSSPLLTWAIWEDGRLYLDF